MGTTTPRDRYGRPLPRGSRDALGSAGDADNVFDSADEARRRGIALFNERRFFEAHECFELVWKAEDIDEEDRDFWRGVTQVAVGCCHVQRENERGALALLDRARGHLRRFPSPHKGIDTTGLITVAGRVAERVRRLGASPDLDFPEFPVSRG